MVHQNGANGSSSQQQIQSLTDGLQKLQKQLEELTRTNKHLVNEVVSLQKTTGAQRQVHYELLHYLENTSKRTQGAVASPAGPVAARGQNDELPPELRRAKELLLSLGPPTTTATTTADGPAEKATDRPHPMYPSPSDSSTSAMFAASDINPGLAVMDGAVAMPRLSVYPSNQPTMEPFPTEQMQAMPYVAQNGGLETVTSGPAVESTRVTVSPPTEKSDDWGPTKPHVFLVEDDNVCAKIGMKFLKSLGCTVASAVCPLFLPSTTP